MFINEREQVEALLGVPVEEVLRQDEFTEEQMVKLLEFYSSEMPYGTMKARTGDPYQWLFNRFSRLMQEEL